MPKVTLKENTTSNVTLPGRLLFLTYYFFKKDNVKFYGFLSPYPVLLQPIEMRNSLLQMKYPYILFVQENAAEY